MTVKELKKSLRGVPDDVEVSILIDLAPIVAARSARLRSRTFSTSGTLPNTASGNWNATSGAVLCGHIHMPAMRKIGDIALLPAV